MNQKEIRIWIPCPHVLAVKIGPATTVKQILERLEELGLKGYVLAAEPKDFLFLPNERIFKKVSADELIYAFPKKGGGEL